jgi:NAD(P)-dependent dehydrogenase (short-subunit alcohol dehydrogenase family)
MGRLQDKVALITGAASGLGLAMARLFAAEGAFVYLTDLDAARAGAEAEVICTQGGRAAGARLDVTEQAGIDAVFAQVKDAHTKLDILVNNAGNLPRADFRHMGDADWDKALNPHLWGTIRVTRAALPLMQGNASVINLSSIMGTRHSRQLSAYSTAKAAIAGLSRSLAVELASYGIRVNYLAPGFIPTPLTGRYTNTPPLAKALLAQVPMRRFGTPEEVAKAALFLASDDSAYITGQCIAVDGGMNVNLA